MIVLKAFPFKSRNVFMSLIIYDVIFKIDAESQREADIFSLFIILILYFP